jgi:hypothetical protein
VSLDTHLEVGLHVCIICATLPCLGDWMMLAGAKKIGRKVLSIAQQSVEFNSGLA